MTSRCHFFICRAVPSGTAFGLPTLTLVVLVSLRSPSISLFSFLSCFLCARHTVSVFSLSTNAIPSSACYASYLFDFLSSCKSSCSLLFVPASIHLSPHTIVHALSSLFCILPNEGYPSTSFCLPLSFPPPLSHLNNTNDHRAPVRTLPGPASSPLFSPSCMYFSLLIIMFVVPFVHCSVCLSFYPLLSSSVLTCPLIVVCRISIM